MGWKTKYVLTAGYVDMLLMFIILTLFETIEGKALLVYWISSNFVMRRSCLHPFSDENTNEMAGKFCRVHVIYGDKVLIKRS